MFRSIRHVLLLPLLGLAAWYLITKLQIFSPYLLPPPAAVWDAFRDSVADGTLWTHLAISLQRVFLGFFLSAVTAIPLGILCGRSRLFYTYGWFLLEFFRHVPPLAAIPLTILWAGIGELSKLVIIFWACFFPLFLNTLSGIRGCDPKLEEVGRSLGFSEGQIIRSIQLPAALDAIVTGLQLSLGYSWRALIGAELVAASAGIGYLILDAEEMSRPDLVLVGIFCIGVIGTLLDWGFLWLVRRCLPWYTVKEAAHDPID